MQLNWENIRDNRIFPGESGGDYDALLGWQNRPGNRFDHVDLTNMTVDEAIEFASPRGPYAAYSRSTVGRTATPMGGFQIVGTTLRGLRDSGRISGDTKLTEDAQNYLGQVILEEQGSGAWEAWRGKPIKPGAFKAPATYEEYKAGKSSKLSDFVRQTEGQATLGNLMAGQPGIPEGRGIFDTYLALNDMNVTAAPVPVAKRENPANQQFSDNAVGNLQNRDYGYQTARTVDDLMGVLGGPEPPGQSASATGQVLPNQAQQASVAADLSGLFSEPEAPAPNAAAFNVFPDEFTPPGTSSGAQGLFDEIERRKSEINPFTAAFASVEPRPSEGLGLFDPIEPEIATTVPSGPPQMLGPRNIAEVPQDSVATSDVLPETPGVQYVAPEPETAPQIQPLEPAVSVAPRTVAAPREPQLDVLPNAAQSVSDTVKGYGLFGDAGEGYSYGYSPWGSGVARVHESAPEQVKIAASGPGLFGAFNKEFGTKLGVTPGQTFSPLAAALGAGAAAAGLGPLGLAIPAVNMFGGGNWLANKLDVVPKEKREQQPVAQPKKNDFLANLFSGNPLKGFAGGLFNAQQPSARSIGGLFGDGGSDRVSFNGPIGRNQRDVSLSSLSQKAINEIDQATRGLY